jgi:hypothetical protein
MLQRLYLSPTQHLCISVPATLWYLNCTNSELVLFGTNVYYIWCQFSIKNKKLSTINGANGDEFSEQHQYQSSKKHHILRLICNVRCK